MPAGKDKSVPHEQHNVVPKASRHDFIRHFRQWKNGKVLLGTAGSWFMLDIAFYGLGLNNSVILQAIGYASTGSTYNILHNIAVGNLIIQCAGTLPGYWFSIAFIDIIGRKPIQIGSFAILTVLFTIIGFAYHVLYAQASKAGFIALFVMCQFFQNFGANTTTVISTTRGNRLTVVYCAWRSFPNSISFNRAWYISRMWEIRCRYCASRILPSQR